MAERKDYWVTVECERCGEPRRLRRRDWLKASSAAVVLCGECVRCALAGYRKTGVWDLY